MEKRDVVRKYLFRNGYTIAVTTDYFDWVWTAHSIGAIRDRIRRQLNGSKVTSLIVPIASCAVPTSHRNVCFIVALRRSCSFISMFSPRLLWEEFYSTGGKKECSSFRSMCWSEMDSKPRGRD